MSLNFAANLSWLFTDLPFLDRIEAAAACGFLGVECLFPHEHDVRAMASRLRTAGLQQVLFNAAPGRWADGDRGLACLPGRQQEFRDTLHQALEHAATLNCPRIHVMAGVLPSGTPLNEREAAWQCYEDNLRWAADLAEEDARVLTIEPINPRDMPHYLLTHQSQAHDLVERIGSPALRVQLDLYHRQIVEGDVTRHLQAVLPTGRVAHIQLAAVPDRGEPDRGELNYASLFETLTALDWDGWIGCEYRPRNGNPGGTQAGLGWLKGHLAPQ